LPGEVKISLVTGEKYVQLSIENQGQPITKEQEELLFQRFYRMEPIQSDMNIPPGYGLGLSIARNIVELHGGRIWLDHQQGDYRFCIEMKRTMHTVEI
jgi:signal transduction histidine kinase